MMWILSICVVSVVSLSVLGLPFLAVDGLIVLVSKFVSLTFRLISSVGLSPVSIEIFSLTARLRLALDMSILSLSVVGIFGILLGCLYRGMFQSNL